MNNITKKLLQNIHVEINEPFGGENETRNGKNTCLNVSYSDYCFRMIK